MSIHLKNINCFYGTHQALFDISLDCPSGETLVLLGPSGAGKSSLIRVLNLLEMPRSGQLSIAGNNFDFSVPLPKGPCVSYAVTLAWCFNSTTCGLI